MCKATGIGKSVLKAAHEGDSFNMECTVSELLIQCDFADYVRVEIRSCVTTASIELRTQNSREAFRKSNADRIAHKLLWIFD